jgi:choline dehydrogenase-like flavoprotein
VLPVFKQSEDYWGGADAMHGDQGEWRVEKQRLHWDILDRYTQARRQAGIPFKQDYNRGDNFGIGHFEVNQKKGVRWNASKAMLRPVLHRPNLKVVTGALIDKLVMEGKEARGVEFSLDGVPTASRRASKPCSPPAPSARRPSCSAPASARPSCCRSAACRCCMNCPASAATCRIICSCA